MKAEAVRNLFLHMGLWGITAAEEDACFYSSLATVGRWILGRMDPAECLGCLCFYSAYCYNRTGASLRILWLI